MQNSMKSYSFQSEAAIYRMERVSEYIPLLAKELRAKYMNNLVLKYFSYGYDLNPNCR